LPSVAAALGRNVSGILSITRKQAAVDETPKKNGTQRLIWRRRPDSGGPIISAVKNEASTK
jgi:hypothetical protein